MSAIPAGAAGAVGDRAGDHQRSVNAGVGGVAARRPDRRLGVERVEDGLDQQQVDPALDKAGDLLPVGLGELPEGHRAVAGVFDPG